MLSASQLLDKLKRHYKDRRVSLLVGAGFSRNAYPKFPLWDELLADMVGELYGSSISLEYRMGGGGETEDEFRERRIREIKSERGYLGIVSEYERRKGNRESIDVYIEERVPYLSGGSTGYSLNTDRSFPFTEANLRTHVSALTCNWAEVYTTNYDNLLEMASDAANLGYMVVCRDYDLSKYAGSRNIIKLHGNLAKDTLDLDYEFDNDCTRRYIISREDYESYPQRHEAFTQMMRIGMLKGVFLLVGFSGTDPNFLAWLNWMTDILNKDAFRDKQDIKVFLIQPSGTGIDRQMQLYYQNHSIGVITLDDTGFLDKVGLSPSSGQSEPDTGACLRGLFDFLNDAAIDAGQKDGVTYETLWRQLYNNSRDGIAEEESVDAIMRHKDSGCLHKSVLLQKHVLDYSLLHKRDKWTGVELSVVSKAIDDIGIAGGFYGQGGPHADEIRSLPAWRDKRHWIALLSDNGMGECRDVDTGEDTPMQEVLRLAFSFKFEDMRRRLMEWSPDGRDIALWGALHWRFDKDKVMEQLQKYIATETDAQSRSIAANVLDYIDFRLPHRYMPHSFGEIDTVGDILRYIDEQIRPADKKVRPYGYEDSQSSAGSDAFDKALPSIRFLDVLMHTGMMPSYGIVYTVAPERWFRVFKNIYEYFPRPALFYSLYLLDRNTCLRIGQEYAYSKELVGILPQLVNDMLDVLISGVYMGNYKAYWWIASEMMVAVDPVGWFDRFVRLMESQIGIMFENGRFYMDEVYDAIDKCVGYIGDAEMQYRMYVFLMRYFRDAPRDIAEILSHLRMEFHLTRDDIAHIKEYIAEMEFKNTVLLMAVLMGNKVLDNDTLDWYAGLIASEFEYDSSGYDWSALHSLTYLAGGNPAAMLKVKEAILQGDIWCCGITGKTSACSFTYLNLSLISDKVKWSEGELKTIMENMDRNVRLMESCNGILSDGFFRNRYIGLLAAMRDFIDGHTDECGLFDGLYRRIGLLIGQIVGDIDFFIALSSDDSFEIDFSLNRLIHEMAHGVTDCHVYKTGFMIDRAILGKKAALHKIILVVEYLAKNYSDMMCSEALRGKVLLLLKIYSSINLVDLNLPIAITCKCMRNVAGLFAGTDDVMMPQVEYWLNDPMATRFNMA